MVVWYQGAIHLVIEWLIALIGAFILHRYWMPRVPDVVLEEPVDADLGGAMDEDTATEEAS